MASEALAGRQIIERRVVRQVNPISVARLAFALSLSLASILLVALVALYMLGIASGASQSVEGFVDSLGLSLDFVGALPAFVIFALIVCAGTTITSVVVTLLYNVLAELVGGVEIVTREGAPRHSR